MFFITYDGLTSFNLRDILYTHVTGVFESRRMEVYFSDNPDAVIILRSETDIRRLQEYIGEHQWIAQSEK